MVLLSRIPSEKQRGSDCGILLPRPFHSLVRREAHGDYWSGILLGSVVFLSAHIIEHCKEDGFAPTLFQETVEFINVCKNMVTGLKLEVVLAMDSNVTLPARHAATTGGGVLRPLKSHSQAMIHQVLSWMQLLGVRALNTFEQNTNTESLWTCGTKRQLEKRSQIDFICVTSGISGGARALSNLDEIFKRGADHRPILADIYWEGQAIEVRVPPPKLLGWKPATCKDLETFQKQCLTEGILTSSLAGIEERLFRLAVGVKPTAPSCSSKLPSLAEAKQAFRHAAPEQRAVKAKELRNIR